MTYNGLPRIRNRPSTAGTWETSGRQRRNDDLHVGFSRSRNDRDVPLYAGRSSDSATVTHVRIRYNLSSLCVIITVIRIVCGTTIFFRYAYMSFFRYVCRGWSKGKPRLNYY